VSDWAPGDLALCVGIGEDDAFALMPTIPQTPGPIVGLSYTVVAVRRAVDCYGVFGFALAFAEIPPRHPAAIGYNARFFRKILPHTPDAEDIETIRLMSGQPVPVEV